MFRKIKCYGKAKNNIRSKSDDIFDAIVSQTVFDTHSSKQKLSTQPSLPMETLKSSEQDKHIQSPSSFILDTYLFNIDFRKRDRIPKIKNKNKLKLYKKKKDNSSDISSPTKIPSTSSIESKQQINQSSLSEIHTQQPMQEPFSLLDSSEQCLQQSIQETSTLDLVHQSIQTSPLCSDSGKHMYSTPLPEYQNSEVGLQNNSKIPHPSKYRLITTPTEHKITPIHILSSPIARTPLSNKLVNNAPSIGIADACSPDRSSFLEKMTSDPLHMISLQGSLLSLHLSGNLSPKYIHIPNQEASKVINGSLSKSNFNTTNVNRSLLSIPDLLVSNKLSTKDSRLESYEKVLELCQQEKALPISTIAMGISTVNGLMKLSEGAYGEIFMYITKDKQERVIKIVPVGENNQNDFNSVISEIHSCIMVNKMNDGIYRNDMECRVPNFLRLYDIKVVKGKYPLKLLSAWNAYNRDNKSENVNPSVYKKTQHYIAIETENGGVDLEQFPMLTTNIAKSKQSDKIEVVKASLAIVTQIIYCLAIAEYAIQFEHRDLHLGNILITAISNESLSYILNDQELTLPTYGYKISIIDYSLSRFVTYTTDKIQIPWFLDLSKVPEIFEGAGHPQYEVYREMNGITNGDWEAYHPVTNLAWIKFIISQLSNCISNQKRISTKNEYVSLWNKVINIPFNQYSSTYSLLNTLIDLLS